ncbi:MAG: hypothetical protein JW951_04980 [Lentisphaerae bacterium]|nr:hypothetical protein [Lentisphaerota bacterium]
MSRTAGILAVGIVLLALPGPARSADEQGLWAVWRQHRENPGAHAAVAAACRAFEAAAPDDPLTAVTRGIAAWHELQQGRDAEAAALLEPLADIRRTPLEEGASDIARAWLTRLDMEQVRAGLRRLYAENVAFPESLDALRALPEAERPPLTDRWGQAWGYRLTGFRMLPEMRDQKYALWSRIPGRDAGGLKEALAVPYAAGIELEPGAPVSAGARPVLAFETGSGDAVHLAVGSRHDGILFAYLGRALIVLANREHWKVIPR